MLKKFFALALMLTTLIFFGKAQAGIITDRLPFQCYVDHQVDTYDQPGGQRVGYISPNVDLVQVTQIRGDGWVYGNYPGRNGRVSRWFKITDICADPGYSNRGATVQGDQTVFRNRSSYEPLGKVLNNESVIVLADNGSRAQILYRLDNGTGYKVGWVPSSSVPSRNVQPVVPTPNINTVTLPDGWYRIQPMHDLGRSADALGPQIGNGNNIHMWTNVDALQQKFYLQNRGNGYFSLQSAYGNKLFVTADGRGPGANLYTSNWNGSDSQLFRLVDAGNNSYHVFAKVGANLEFDCHGGYASDGNNIQLWTREENPWHKWRFTKENVSNPTPTPAPSGKFDWPVPGHYKINTTYTYSSGKIHSSRYSYNGRPCGIDIGVPEGTDVRAVASGIVVNQINRGSESFGKWLEIRHDDGTCSVYAHLSDYSMVRVGQHVNKGDVIARSGNTGNSTGPHLHFELSGHDTYQYYKNLGVIR